MKSVEFTIERMTMREHSDASHEALFGCEDEDRRNYKIMYGSTLVDQELTFSEAQEWKTHYEAEDAYAREEYARMRELAEFLEENDYGEVVDFWTPES